MTENCDMSRAKAQNDNTLALTPKTRRKALKSLPEGILSVSRALLDNWEAPHEPR